jgi:ribosomal protein L40E
MTVLIHGKEYITVAERLTKAHSELEKISITTEVLYTDPVVVRATVITPKGTFTGISAANPVKSIEKESPYEVAESSAVGRALAFAGYETTNGIASAEEMKKVSLAQPVSSPNNEFNNSVCQKCGAKIAISSTGKPYCSAKCWLK